jgi:hypothetical protein
MHLREILRTQLDLALATFGTPINILETGTIRNADPQYAADDGWSTLHFAEWCKEHEKCHLESVDLDISVAKAVLEHHGYCAPDVLLHREHSIEWLGKALESRAFFKEKFHGAPRTIPMLHVAYLDSDNDPTLILNEYLLVKIMMPPGGIVMVDDCNPETGGNKGNAIRPWLEAHQQEYTLVGRRGDGYATNVLITRIP